MKGNNNGAIAQRKIVHIGVVMENEHTFISIKRSISNYSELSIYHVKINLLEPGLSTSLTIWVIPAL